MNYRVLVLMITLAVGGTGGANGQFLKKLGKKVERAAERTVERRAERETTKRTDQALDKVLEPGDKKGKKGQGGTKGEAAAPANGDTQRDGTIAAKKQAAMAAILGVGSMDDIPDRYTFSYRATMKLSGRGTDEETVMQYWLEPDAAYFGTQTLIADAGDNIAVMDMESETMVMFMDDGERKTAMLLSADQGLLNRYLMMTMDGETGKKIKVTPMGSKTMLGYRCEGFQMETDDGTSNVWVTNDAPAGFSAGMFRGDKVPEGLPDFGDQALLMEVEYIPKDGKGKYFHMVCAELVPASMVIQKKDYQSAI